MAKLLKVQRDVEEGEIINKWFKNRMIRRNQNILNATTGPTGSGKSYLDLAIANSWYMYYFKKPFPIENCCFSIGETMRLLSKGKLKRGELIIQEEAGVNLGNLEFQNRVSKLFTYVLQSFRSMNVGILFNLPILTMLNKSARLLIHSHFIMKAVDYEKKSSVFRAYFRQINQQTGKIYDKYMRVKISGRTVVVKRFKYKMPPKELIAAYERKKHKFVSELSENFAQELEELDKLNLQKMGRKYLTEIEQEVYDYLLEGTPVKEIAKMREVSKETIYETIKRIEKKGFRIEKSKKSLGK